MKERIRVKGVEYVRLSEKPSAVFEELEKLNSEVHAFGNQLKEAIYGRDSEKAIQLLKMAKKKTPEAIDRLIELIDRS